MLRIDNLSYWEKSTYLENIDFLIIGSGIVGLSTAIFLKKKNKNYKVLVIDRGYLPTGASTKNAGFTCFGSPTELFDDLQNMNELTVWDTFSNRYMGLNTLFELVQKDKIAYRECKSWDIISSKKNNDITKDFIEYINHKAYEITGVKEIYHEDKLISSKFGFEGINTSYCNKLEGAIHTGKMIQELYKKAILNDVNVLFGMNAEKLDHSAQENVIETQFGEIKAKNTIIATNGFAKKWIKDDILPARAQVIITNEIPDLKINGTFHYEKGYYYFRNVGNRVLLGGGRNLDFKGETTEEFGSSEQIRLKLLELLKNVILPKHTYEIQDSWSGIMGVGKSKSPIIKKINNNTAIGVRMGGMGVAIGAQVGKKLADLF
ncbi:MAG: FAD-binding oxidoreductase [Bacteroidota bacterium]|nr:FAD-binding oxidoreductase [Bacteroidota bacterium]